MNSVMVPIRELRRNYIFLVDLACKDSLGTSASSSRGIASGSPSRNSELASEWFAVDASSNRTQPPAGSAPSRLPRSRQKESQRRFGHFEAAQWPTSEVRMTLYSGPTRRFRGGNVSALCRAINCVCMHRRCEVNHGLVSKAPRMTPVDRR
jgi:hypothetical protein